MSSSSSLPIRSVTVLTISSLAYSAQNDEDGAYCFTAMKTIFDQAMPELQHQPPKNIELFKLMYSDGELNPSDCIDALKDIQVCTLSTVIRFVHVANTLPSTEQMAACIHRDRRCIHPMSGHHKLPHSGIRYPIQQTPHLSRHMRQVPQGNIPILSRVQLCGDCWQEVSRGSREGFRLHLCYWR